jgi:hypothetical protein
MTMRRTLQLLTMSLAALFALGAAQAARAQDTTSAPRVEIFGGYSYMNANIVIAGTRFGLNGASGSVAYNFNNWLGVVGDFGVYGQGSVAANGRSLTVSSYQFGPRISLRGHAPLGANNGFMLTAGGGVDWKLNHTIGIRIIQTEYLYSQFLNAATGSNSNHQNNLRISAGILFSFGKR